MSVAYRKCIKRKSEYDYNGTGESLAEKVVDPDSLKLGIPDQAGENDTLGRIIGECGIIRPSSEMEEGEEMAECQERILNETD